MRIALVAAIVTACQGETVEAAKTDVGVDTTGSVDTAAGVDTAGETAGETSSPGCSGRASTTSMVNVGTYCIDRTEVTNAQWREFVKEPTTLKANTPAFCDWDKYVPPVEMATDRDNVPMGDVDICNAHAYCKWAGKRLCGKIGGGPAPFTAFADANKDEWYRVCSNGGADKFPYGSAYLENKCADGMISPMAVGSFPECRGSGPYVEVVDMSGNVSEWADGCNAPTASSAAVLCHTRGGGTGDGAKTACDWEHGANASAHWVGLGFRCCKDP